MFCVVAATDAVFLFRFFYFEFVLLVVQKVRKRG